MDEGGRHVGNDEIRMAKDKFSGWPASFSESRRAEQGEVVHRGACGTKGHTLRPADRSDQSNQTCAKIEGPPNVAKDGFFLSLGCQTGRLLLKPVLWLSVPAVKAAILLQQSPAYKNGGKCDHEHHGGDGGAFW
jgi:hypothetical protein